VEEGSAVTPLDWERIERETLVRRVEYFDQTYSTNDVALALAEEEDGPFPLLVWAARQTSGRGRGSNRWWASEGALTFSLALDAPASQLPPARRPLVSLAAGLAVCEAVAALAPQHPVGVKWPNDVHLEGRKVCGILAESARRGERLIVGVGLNVNNTLVEAPEDIRRRAVALVDALGLMLPLTDVLIRVLQRFSEEWVALLENDDLLVERLRRRCVLTGRRIAVEVGDELIAGICRGYADDGALLIETPTTPRRLYAGVVASWE
jgi:BirA family biotin operon repressor/biotin-[acetyl-CoA-carboxylase] ligase